MADLKITKPTNDAITKLHTDPKFCDLVHRLYALVAKGGITEEDLSEACNMALWDLSRNRVEAP